MKKVLILLSFMLALSVVEGSLCLIGCEQPQKTQRPSTQPEPLKTVTITGQKPVTSPYIQVSGTAAKEPRADK